ncbi:AAA family ATPase [Methanobrevibacter sp.]|uniref:AAA family ATPase n=1 Tax=Methanobrevibacter sp. TaxID=66852 RepID=UPI00388FA850
MAKKEKRSGLGKGLDSLIPKIEEKEVEEGISLEDILKNSEEKSEDAAKDDAIEETVDETLEETDDDASDEIIFDEEPDEDDKELIFPEDDEDSENKILVEESDVEKYVEEIAEEEVSEDDYLEDTSIYTTVFHNDDEKISDENDEEIAADLGVENIDSTINLNEDEVETTKIIDDSINLKEGTSFLTEKEEKLIDEVIETVENNPRITLWSARSAAVLRYLRKTEPEFSISSEASNLIDAAIAEKYPEIWTLFNHL